MATATILLDIGAGVLPDGSSGNAAPAIGRYQGTETNPKKHFLGAAFDASTAEYLWFTFRLPTDYTSSPVIKLQWMANSTSGNVVWSVRAGAVTAGDADTPIEHAAASAQSNTAAVNGTEANRLVETSIAISNTDSMAAGDLISLVAYRDAANGSDTCTADAVLVAAAFEYTA